MGIHARAIQRDPPHGTTIATNAAAAQQIAVR
jgi:hypothetical protein